MTNYEQLMAMLQAERAQPQYRRNEFGVPVELLSAGMDGYVDPASINVGTNGQTGNAGLSYTYDPTADQFAVTQGDATSGFQRWLAGQGGVQDLGFQDYDRKGNWNQGAGTLAALAAGGTLAAYGGGLMGAAGAGSAAPAAAAVAPAAAAPAAVGGIGSGAGAAGAAGSAAVGLGDFLGEGVASGVPAWDAAAGSGVGGGFDWSSLLGRAGSSLLSNPGLLSAGVGALAGIAGNDNMQNTQTGSSGLASWMQPYAQDVVARQQFMANQPATNWALDTSQGLLGQYATQGTPLTNAAMQQQQNVIGGGMLNSNPYIDQVASNIGSRMGEAYATGTRAGTFDAFSGDGNSPLGKSAFRQTLGNNDRAFGDALGSTMSNLYMGNYNQERAAQDAAARGSTGLANFGVQNAGLLGQSGADSWQRPYTQLQNYQSALSPAFGQQTSSTQNIQAPNNWMAGLGGAALGAGMYKSIFG